MPVSAAIEATNDLASAAGRAIDQKAPRIPDGSNVVVGAMVRQAEREHKKRKTMNETGSTPANMGATTDEVSESKVRKVAVEMASALETSGDAL